MSDLNDLRMMTKDCTFDEIRQMFKFHFNINTYEIFYNGKFYQASFRHWKCIDVYCLMD